MQKESKIRDPLILGNKTYHDITKDIARPVEGTLMDYFPDPPLHLIGTIPLAILLFYIAYLPLQIKDLLRVKAAK